MSNKKELQQLELSGKSFCLYAFRGRDKIRYRSFFTDLMSEVQKTSLSSDLGKLEGVDGVEDVKNSLWVNGLNTALYGLLRDESRLSEMESILEKYTNIKDMFSSLESFFEEFDEEAVFLTCALLVENYLKAENLSKEAEDLGKKSIQKTEEFLERENSTV